MTTESEAGAGKALAVRTVVSVLGGLAAVHSVDAGAAAVAATPIAEATVGLIAQLLGRRRVDHASEVITLAADEGGITVERLVEDVLRDDEHQELLARVLMLAQDVARLDKRRALARALARAAAGDTDTLDREFLLIRAIADLEGAHIRLLWRLERSRPGLGQLTGHAVSDGWRREEIAKFEPDLADFLAAMLSALEAHGLVGRENTYEALEGNPMWSITAQGERLLIELASPEEPSEQIVVRRP